MKKTIPMKQAAAIVAVLLLAILVYGRTRLSSSEPPPAPVPRAPAGMVLVRDAGEVATGTKLYTQDGKYMGTVRGYEPSHDFAVPGGPQAGYLIVHEPSTTPTWLPSTIVSNSYYMKK